MLFRPLTLQEANTFLPLVKERFAKMHALVTEGRLLQDSLMATRPQSVATHDSQGNPQPQAPLIEDLQQRKTYKRRLIELDALVREEIEDLGAMGITVKEILPARVDFLSSRYHQLVFLSWHMGEKSVSHWHGIDESDAYRKPITIPEAFGPVVVH